MLEGSVSVCQHKKPVRDTGRHAHSGESHQLPKDRTEKLILREPTPSKLLLAAKSAKIPLYCTVHLTGKGLKSHQASRRLVSPHRLYHHLASLEPPPPNPPAHLSLPQWNKREPKAAGTMVTVLKCLPLPPQRASALAKGATRMGKTARLE